MTTKPTHRNTVLLVCALLIFVSALAVLGMAIHMKGERSFLTFLSSRPGVLFLVAIGAALGSVALIVYLLSSRARIPAHQFARTALISVITMALLFSIFEIALRASSINLKDREVLFGTELRPLNWSEIALRHRALTQRAAGDLSYLVHDGFLGWTVAANRVKADILYSTDSRGLRIPHSHMAVATATEKVTIALLGDSYTFGQELEYEDTWGYLLEKSLGPQFKVLNFGVPGYGVDQAFLRFERDVLVWKPKIVIYAINSGAVRRTMIVYTFLSRPDWNYPFSKPRFIVRDGELKEINAPALSPEAIFSKASIFELPFLEYDVGYKQSDWQYKPYQFSFLARLLVSRYPSWSRPNPDTSDEALVAVNTAVLRAFVQSARQAGTIPIVAYLPGPADVQKPNSSPDIGRRVLEETGIKAAELGPCLLKADSRDRVVPSGAHYSRKANAALAECLHTVVNQALGIR